MIAGARFGNNDVFAKLCWPIEQRRWSRGEVEAQAMTSCARKAQRVRDSSPPTQRLPVAGFEWSIYFRSGSCKAVSTMEFSNQSIDSPGIRVSHAISSIPVVSLVLAFRARSFVSRAQALRRWSVRYLILTALVWPSKHTLGNQHLTVGHRLLLHLSFNDPVDAMSLHCAQRCDISVPMRHA
nr:hypothetical protein CFP56_56533 [Quercus suber]